MDKTAPSYRQRIKISNRIIESAPFQVDGTCRSYTTVWHEEYHGTKEKGKKYEQYRIRKYDQVRPWYFFGEKITKVINIGWVTYVIKDEGDEHKNSIEGVKFTCLGLPRDFTHLKANLQDYLGVEVELYFDSNKPY